MRIAIGVHSIRADFALVIDGEGNVDAQNGTTRKQVVQICHRTFFPEEGTGVIERGTIACERRISHHLGCIVNRAREAADIVTQSSEVREFPNFSPQTRVELLLAGKVCEAHYLSAIVLRGGPCVITSETAAQVVQSTVLPDISALVSVPGNRRKANDRSSIGEPCHEGASSSEISQIAHSVCVIPDECVGAQGQTVGCTSARIRSCCV